MSVKFQRQVIQLKPDLVIFFDGFNEFNSIIYGGIQMMITTGQSLVNIEYTNHIDFILIKLLK